MEAGTWRLGRRPGLDGLRGVAIAFVVVSHLVAPDSLLHTLGPIGVTVFFTLSGFLITALMLEERQRTGQVNVVAFYGRRARRLLPALVVMVAAVSAVGVVIRGFVSWKLVAGALTYSSNWVAIGTHAAGDPLEHTWSLAVEEQFYVVWPIVFLALLALPALWQTRVLGAAVALTAVLPLTMYSRDPDAWLRVYHGSDTRAMPILAGCLLAWWMSRTRSCATSRPVLAAAAVLGTMALAESNWRVLVYAAPQMVAVLTAVAIWAVVSGPGVGWLQWAPLVLLGQRSYGVYLWHWPVVVLASRWVDGWALAVVAVPIAVALAAASWRFVEEPFLRRGRRAVAPTAVPVAAL